MTREQFRQGLKQLGMSRGTFAKHTGVHPSTAYHWGTEQAPVPQWAQLLLAAWLDNARLRAQWQQLDRAAMPKYEI